MSRNRNADAPGRTVYLREWRVANKSDHWVLRVQKRALWATVLGIRVKLNRVARVVANA